MQNNVSYTILSVEKREIWSLGEVKNYFPFMTDFEAMSDYEIRDRFGNDVQQFGKVLKDATSYLGWAPYIRDSPWTYHKINP